MRLEQAYAALRFDPALPWWALGALAALCAVALLPALLRRARLPGVFGRVAMATQRPDGGIGARHGHPTRRVEAVCPKRLHC